MAKRKHSPLKRLQRQLNNCRIWSWKSDYDHKDGVRFVYAEAKLNPLLSYRPVDQFLPEIITYPFNWKICARVLCTNGIDEWLETADTFVLQTPLKSVEHIYTALENEALAAQQSKQVVDVGWIAQTFYKDKALESGWEKAHMGHVSEERQMLYRLYSV